MSFEYPAASQGPWPAAPKGIILHGTRGGNPNRRNEFLGTVRWATNNPDGLGWHVTIGDGYYAEHLPITEWGWHAREHSRQYIGVEFVQPTVSDAITDDQVAAFARWYRETVAPAFPHLGRDPLMPAHSEMKSGIADGKTDPYPKGDARNEALRQRLYAALAEPTPVVWNVGPGVAAAMARHNDTPIGHEQYLVNGLSTTPGRDALYLYEAASDTVYRAPKA